jgi:hypothetical protein
LNESEARSRAGGHFYLSTGMKISHPIMEPSSTLPK